MNVLLINGKVWIGKDKFVDAIGWDAISGIIVELGHTNNISKKNYDEIIDLKGKVVLPSFIEGHCHLVKGSKIKKELNLRNAKTRKDIKELIYKYKETLHKNKWIQGGYFTETEFIENFKIDRCLLDEICPDIPIFLQRIDLHSAIVNTKAIELTGVDKQIEKFGTEEIIINDNGELTGELKERAMFFVYDQIPPKTTEEICNAVEDEIKYLNSLGITAITDITYPEDIEIYGLLLARDKFSLEINSSLLFQQFPEFEKIQQKFSIYDKIKFNTFKAFYDGALSSESAYLWNNYKGKNHNGIKTDFVKSGEFEKLALEIDKSNKQIMVHAIGDRAVSELLDFVELLEKINGKRDRRFRIEHAQHILQRDFDRFIRLNVVTSVQPAHLYVDALIAIEKLENFENTHNYKNIIQKGGIVCFGTDFPVANESPFETIYYAMTRKIKNMENGFYPELALDLNTCLESYTYNNAYACFDEKSKGKLQTGYYANLIVLNNDIFECNSTEIKDTKVEMTFLKGKRIF
ncbi:MAG: amidohydrolase [Ignavibacteria bacterium]|nr:amidohydrolase [Ignavibacteria bacterium]